METNRPGTRKYAKAEIVFLHRLQRDLQRHGQTLRTGHIDLALTTRSASSWNDLLNVPALLFAVIVGMAGVAASLMAYRAPGAVLTSVAITLIVAAVGLLCYAAIPALAPYRHVAAAAAAIEQARLDDQRVLAGLTGRRRRRALSELASFTPAWVPDTAVVRRARDTREAAGND